MAITSIILLSRENAKTQATNGVSLENISHINNLCNKQNTLQDGAACHEMIKLATADSTEGPMRSAFREYGELPWFIFLQNCS